jgi:glycosyltransferase involved in cell wall biosynthesis
MRIAFLDPSTWQYTVDSPYSQPFGGSQSALCYLAVELARLGHAVAIFNGNPGPTESRGVQLRNLSEVQSPGFLNGFDVVVVLNSAIGRSLRRDFRVTVPMVLWNQHAADQPAILELNRLNERKSWTGFAFVSNWQREDFEKVFWVRREKSRVLRNAVSPAFADAPPPDKAPWFITGEPPTLFYTSTPFRGLDVLLQAFPMIRAAIPGTRLRVFSSMSVYQVRPEDDQYRGLYSQAQTIDGVEYVGAMGQSRLAQELSGVAALAYPSTFAETSCIAALEAMATGAAVLTTRLGALPETTNGLASMVEWQPDNNQLAASFAATAIEVLRDMQQNLASTAARRDERIKFIRENYLWPGRAREWVDWLSQLAGGDPQ